MKKNKSVSDNEVYKIYDEYCWNKGSFDITYLCGNITPEERLLIEDIILSKDILTFDAPDAVIKLKDKTIIIEHFKIDASQRYSKKGTLLNQLTQGDTAFFDRDVMLKEIPASVTNLEELEQSDFKERLKKYSSYDHLASNFVKSYVEHYSKIETYKSNALDSGEPNLSTNFEIVFFVQDVTPIDKLIPDYSEIATEAVMLERERNNIGAYVDKIKDKPVDHIFFFSRILNKPRIFYANKRIVVDLKMIQAKK